MAIYHGAEPVDNYGKVPNEWSRDPNLSMDETGLLAYLRGHRSGYALTVEQMIAQFADGKDAIRATLNRLIDKGYVRRLYERDRGRIVEVHYLVIGVDGGFPQVEATSGKAGTGSPGSGVTRDDAEFPQVGTTSGKAGSGSASSGKSAPKKTTTKKTKVLEDQEDHSLSGAAEPAGLAPVAALRERDDPATPTTTPKDPAVAIIVKHCPGVTVDDAHAAVERIKANEDVRTVTGLVVTASRNGTLPALVAQTLDAVNGSAGTPVQPSYGDHTRAVANEPTCGHGYPGGNIPIPGTLWSPCSLCRRDAGWTPDTQRQEVAA